MTVSDEIEIEDIVPVVVDEHTFPPFRPLSIWLLESYLDLLVEFASQSGLIVGADKSDTECTVIIHLSVVSVSMFFGDAVEYLSETLLEEFQQSANPFRVVG